MIFYILKENVYRKARKQPRFQRTTLPKGSLAKNQIKIIMDWARTSQSRSRST